MNHFSIGAHQSNSTAVNTTPMDDPHTSSLASGLNRLINTYISYPLPDSANITQMLDAAWHYLVAHPGMRDQFEMEFSTLLDSHMESAPAGETDLMTSFLGQVSIMSSRQPTQNSAPARQVGETELRLALVEFDPALRAPDVNIHTLLDRARQNLSLNLSDSTPGGAATHRLLLKLDALLRKGDMSQHVRQLLHEFLNPVISHGLNRLGKPPLINIAQMAFPFNFHETLQYTNAEQEVAEEFKGFKNLKEFKELSLSKAPNILKKMEASRRWDLIAPVIHKVTHNTINDILALYEYDKYDEDSEDGESKILKASPQAIEELKKFIMDSKLRPAAKANLLIELIRRVAIHHDCGECKVSEVTASLRECMKDLGVMLRELSLSSHGCLELNVKNLESAILHAMDAAVDYTDDSSSIAVELIKLILKEPNNQANRIAHFFELVDEAFSTHINGESVDLTSMVNELLKAGISSKLAAELYDQSPHWGLFERAIQDIAGLRMIKENDNEIQILDLSHILINTIKSSNRDYVLFALKFLKSQINKCAKDKFIGDVKFLQKSFADMLHKIEHKIVPASDVVDAIPPGLSPIQQIHWLANQFPQLPEIDFFSNRRGYYDQNLFEVQMEKWLNRKRERSESQDSQHSQP